MTVCPARSASIWPHRVVSDPALPAKALKGCSDKYTPISSFSQTSLSLTATSSSCSSRRVQVAWVGVGGEIDKLAQLQERIEASLARLGFPRESRRFTAHLTLARFRDRASPEEQQELGQLIADTRFEANTAIEVDAISLMKSQLTREGAIYTRIGSVGLNKPLSKDTA
ncbi:RNA 2',3'-cyclic phosphodiesterase [Chloroflexota bacterium]